MPRHSFRGTAAGWLTCCGHQGQSTTRARRERLSGLLAVGTYKDRSRAPGTSTSQAAVTSHHHMLGHSFGWQRGARGTCPRKAPKYLLAGARMGVEPNPWAPRPPTAPRARGGAGRSPVELAGWRSAPASPGMAWQAPAVADTLEQVGSSGISRCKQAPSTCSVAGGKRAATGNVCTTTSSLNPIQHLPQIESSANPLPVDRLGETAPSHSR